VETCIICGDLQDSKQYGGYNICTTCADLMEDVMGEYFVHTVSKNRPKAHAAYLDYLGQTTGYISDYKKLTVKSRKYTKDAGGRVSAALIQNGFTPSKQRYFERMQQVLDWLGSSPEFYHYYFKEYYICPACGASIFEKYCIHNVGEWMVVSCSECDSVIKKYYSPKQV
jgi:hypothetical protein